jgi:hypothetical protein
MLSLQHFPIDHIGHCYACVRDRQRASPSDQILQEQSDNSDPPQGATLRQERTQTAPVRANTAGQPPSSHSRQNLRTFLPGSVTSYSDAGAHPSDRSTYGRNKPKPKRTKHTGPLPASQTGRLLQNKATKDQLAEVEALFQSLTQDEFNMLADRRAMQNAAEPQATQLALLDDCTTASEAGETEEEDTEGGVTIDYNVTPVIAKCTEEIVCAWGVKDISEIFPQEIWPNPKTPWNLGVLKAFLDLARKYPNARCRKGITTKFAGLVKKRRSTPGAKTQWAIADATATKAWAEMQYRHQSASRPSDAGQGSTADANRSLTSSQRLRKPSAGLSNIQRLKRNKQKRRKQVYSIVSSSELSEN